jgi:hypothetical protein
MTGASMAAPAENTMSEPPLSSAAMSPFARLLQPNAHCFLQCSGQEHFVFGYRASGICTCLAKLRSLTHTIPATSSVSYEYFVERSHEQDRTDSNTGGGGIMAPTLESRVRELLLQIETEGLYKRERVHHLAPVVRDRGWRPQAAQFLRQQLSRPRRQRGVAGCGEGCA